MEGREHNREPTAHAVGEAGSHTIPHVRKIEAVEQVLGPGLPAALESTQAGRQLDVLPGSGPRDESADVRAVPNPVLGRDRAARDVDPSDSHGSGRRGWHAGEYLQRRRLARAVLADQGNRGPRVDSQIEAVHGAHLPELDDQMLDVDRRGHA